MCPSCTYLILQHHVLRPQFTVKHLSCPYTSFLHVALLYVSFLQPSYQCLSFKPETQCSKYFEFSVLTQTDALCYGLETEPVHSNCNVHIGSNKQYRYRLFKKYNEENPMKLCTKMFTVVLSFNVRIYGGESHL